MSLQLGDEEGHRFLGPGGLPLRTISSADLLTWGQSFCRDNSITLTSHLTIAPFWAPCGDFASLIRTWANYCVLNACSVFSLQLSVVQSFPYSSHFGDVLYIIHVLMFLLGMIPYNMGKGSLTSLSWLPVNKLKEIIDFFLIFCIVSDQVIFLLVLKLFVSPVPSTKKRRECWSMTGNLWYASA